MASFVVVGCEQNCGNIEGSIVDESGQPVSEVWIRAVRSGSPSILITADEDGSYILENIPTGEWEIEFYNKHGWGVGRGTVTVRSSETTRLNVTISVEPLPDLPRITPPY